MHLADGSGRGPGSHARFALARRGPFSIVCGAPPWFRWFAYSGSPALIEDILIQPKHSLVDQSLLSRSPDTPTNGDGFGLGWDDDRPEPGRFRSIRPAWNDFNLRDLAGHIQSRMCLAHVRATSLATVQETNCHPFRHKKWLFVHNGEIFQVETIQKTILSAIRDDLVPCIQGTTDSEMMFYLALTFGLEDDPLGALARMAGFLEEAGRSKGIEEILWMTLGVADGERLYAVRYASDGEAPSLFYSRDLDGFYNDHPERERRFASTTRLVASEVTGSFGDLWLEVPQGSCLTIDNGKVTVEPFSPGA